MPKILLYALFGASLLLAPQVAGAQDAPSDSTRQVRGRIAQNLGRNQGLRGPERDQIRGGQRQLSMLNPEISITGDLLGTWLVDGPATAPVVDRFYLRAAECHILAPLDPYTRGKFFLDIPGDGNFTIDEAYMEWVNLPHGMNLKAGQFRVQFGQLNRWHEHGLPQVDRPLLLERFFGPDPLAGTGIGGNWMFQLPLAHVNELDLQYITGSGGASFAGEGNEAGVVVGRLKNYWDLTPSAYFELGLSGARGKADPDGLYDNELYGVDLSYKWVPIGRGGYRTFELRSEFFMGRRESAVGRLESKGGYAYFQNRMGSRLWFGLRGDWTELPEDPDRHEGGLAFDLTAWQSEFVFFRLQVARFEPSWEGAYTRLTFQTVWSMGPHKHEAY